MLKADTLGLESLSIPGSLLETLKIQQGLEDLDLFLPSRSCQSVTVLPSMESQFNISSFYLFL